MPPENNSIDELDLAKISRLREGFADLTKEIRKVFVGQEKVVEELLIALLCRGHVLLEGVPGLGKTLLIRTIADVLSLDFKRIQFTPDLMPSDATGTEVVEEDLETGKRTFRFVKGPIFANIVLADEINRAPPKTQAALLEAMQEYAVTMAGQTYPLDLPFFILATQNPIEQEGTYPLPEAQVDRFMLKVIVDYPSRDEELEILRRMTKGDVPGAVAVTTPEQIIKARKTIYDIYVDEKIENYIVDIVMATREPARYGLDDLGSLIDYGASPRASIYLTIGAKAYAFLRGRGYVTPEDIRAIGMEVLRHRIIPSYEAEAEEITPETIVTKVFEKIEIP